MTERARKLLREERERERQQLSRCARQHTTNMRIMKKPHLNNKLLRLDGFSLFAAERLKIRQMKREHTCWNNQE